MDTEPVLLAGRGSGGPGQRPARRARALLALRLAGGGLLVATGAIHLDLYLTGYRSIPTIGWLYTYVGDSAPGQANGNGLNLNGGLWHEVPASG